MRRRRRRKRLSMRRRRRKLFLMSRSSFYSLEINQSFFRRKSVRSAMSE